MIELIPNPLDMKRFDEVLIGLWAKQVKITAI
jgi:hypothetical protein